MIKIVYHININNIDMMRLLYEELLKTSELISSNNITEAKLEMAKHFGRSLGLREPVSL